MSLTVASAQRWGHSSWTFNRTERGAGALPRHADQL